MTNISSREKSFVLTKKKFTQLQEKFGEITQNVSAEIRHKAGTNFFNPFRSGIYFAQVQVLYLLGCNEYHRYKVIEDKLQEMLSSMIIKIGVNKGKNKWEIICRKEKTSKGPAKDQRGKIQYNYFLLQRLGANSPYGYKLAQALSCIDILENSNKLLEYRLNTCFKKIEEVDPYYTHKRKMSQIRFLERSHKLVQI